MSFRRAVRLLSLVLLCALLFGLGLVGCRREVQAPGDPVAAVKGMAEALRDNDLVRYSRLSMPPALHRRMEARWVSAAVLDWMTPAMLSDRERARAAIKILVETARELELPTLEASRRLEMIPALEKGGQALRGLKRMAGVYGIDADASLAAVQARVVDARGERATVEVRYPLLGKTVAFDMKLLRRDGRWYSAEAVEQAEADLAKPLVPAGTPVRAR